MVLFPNLPPPILVRIGGGFAGTMGFLSTLAGLSMNFITGPVTAG
jgi:hypothetical protein